MQGFESSFRSVFLLQPQRREGNGPREYQFDAPVAPLAAAWAHRGIPHESPSRRREIEPRLARAIVQALAITESI